jgi:ammonia channel protein AmtB
VCPLARLNSVLSILGAVAILAVIPAMSILYREFLDRGGLRPSIGLTVIVSASSLLIWLAGSAFLPGVWMSPLELPVAALAAVGGFLTSLPVRDTTSHPLPVVIFSLGWTILVFAPVATVVLFPASIGLGAASGPVDLGATLPINVAVGGGALVVLLFARRRAAEDRSHVRPRSWLLVTAGLLLWAGWIGGYIALEGGLDSVVTPRIVVSTVIAPILGVAGWLIAQRVQTATTTAFGAVCGLLAGLVAVSAGSGYFTPLWAGFTGLVAGLACSLFATGLARRTGRHAWLLVGVHLLAASIGLLTVGFFALQFGFLYTGSTALIEVQFVAAAAVTVWSALVSLLLWLPVRALARRSPHSRLEDHPI